MYGKGMAGVDRQRRQDGEDLVDEHPSQLEVPLGSFVVPDDGDALLGHRLTNLVEGQRVLDDQVEHLASCLGQRLGGAATVRPELRMSRLDLLLETRHADLEELVEDA